MEQTRPEGATSHGCEPTHIEDHATGEIGIDDGATFQQRNSNTATQGHFDQPASYQHIADMPVWGSEVLSAMETNLNSQGTSDLLSPFDVGWDYSSLLSDSTLFMMDSAPPGFQTV